MTAESTTNGHRVDDAADRALARVLAQADQHAHGADGGPPPGNSDRVEHFYREMRARDEARARLDAEQARIGAGFADRLLTRGALDRIPPLAPLISGTLELGTDAMLAGPYGSCKSFVALSWAASIATGHPWQGRDVARAGPVVYVAGEGASGIGPRLAAWEQATETAIPDDRLLTLPVPVNLSRPVEVAEFVATIRDHRPILVIFETLNRCAVGADENSATEMGRVVDAIRRVREATADGQGATLLVHHTGKDGTVRGSSSLAAAMDTVYQTSGNAALVQLSRTKRKDGEAADELSMSLRTLGQSGVLDLVHSPDTAASAQDRVLSAFVSAFSETGGTKADLRKIAGVPNATFHRAVNALVTSGALVDIGRPRAPFYRLGKTT